MSFFKMRVFVLSVAITAINCFSETDDEVQIIIDTSLNNQGKTVRDLIPKYWDIIDTCKGDINRDGINELIVIAQSNDSSKITVSCIDQTENDNNRVLGIYFKDKNGIYKKFVEARTVIPYKMCNADEPFTSIAINKKGIISINLYFWMSAGSWSMGSRTYKYRYQNSKIMLIGIEDNTAQRNTGETIETSINFLTKKVIYKYGNYSKDAIDSTVTKKFDLKGLFTIDACDTSMGYYSTNLLP